MLSLTCKTAIKAVIYLATKFDSGEKCGIKEIAKYINASEHTVGKMLQTLVREDIIKSTKGPAGGFYITASQKVQPIIRIVHAIDGQSVFKQCGLGLSKCSATHPCPLHDQYMVVRSLYEDLCKSNTLAGLLQPVSTGLAHLAG
ncbi:MAG: transcriptional regulator [Chitinophagaceae bacterium]|nr:MAG: transcriptional regulator [Chitinophagaceae bacterium]